MKVELIDLKKRYKEEKKEILSVIDRVLSKGNLIMTEEVFKFEKEICRFTKSKYCSSLNSGTDALMMALWASGIKKGDEVITTSKSFIATIGAIVHVGAIPILVDVTDDLNINVNLIEKKITKKTKAIVPVHWTGRMCDMDKLQYLSKKYNIKIIEDAAQAMGSYYKKIHAGKFSNVAAFSCHPLKNLNALGDSGFITTDDKKIFDKINLYKNHGLKSRDKVEILGVNSRLDVLNSCVLSLRLKKLNKVIKTRNNNIKLYRKYIKTDKVKILPDQENKINSSVIFNIICERRDDLKKFLDKANIQTFVYYGTPLHLHKPMKKYGYKKGDFPVAENLCKKVLALPHNQYVTTDQIEFVSEKINNFFKKFN